MRNILFIGALFLACCNAAAQCPYFTQLIKDGERKLKKDSIRQAINLFSTAMTYCPDSAEVAGKKILEAFDKIEGLKKEAETAFKEAKKSKEETQIALNKANRLINAFYFYEDKYALAYGDMFNADEDEYFYFIDKNGTPALHLRGWERAEQFDSRGFSKVKTDYNDDFEGDCLLDISGRVYRVAYHVDSLNDDITALDLSGQNLMQIPTKVFEYDSLKVLLLDNNKLDSISDSLSMLKKLIVLNLGSNSLTVLPAALSQLENLEILDLSNNDIKSPISAIADLTKLKALNLRSALHKNIYEKETIAIPIDKLVNLDKLNLTELNLSKLPTGIGQLKNLTDLDLTYNDIDDVEFEKISQLTKLTKLDMAYNELRYLPPSIGKLKALNSLNLHSNNLRNIPSEIGNLIKLKKLDLFSNDSLHYLPISFSKLQNLVELDLGECGIKEVPEALYALRNIQKLDLSDNDNIEISSKISQLQNLTHLIIYGANLKKLPNAIKTLRNLSILDLSENPGIELPEAIKYLENLTQLTVTDCEIGRFPLQVTELKNLVFLDLSSNKLDSLPPQIGNLKRLLLLNFSGNSLKWLPNDICELNNLVELDLDSNKLTSLPEEISNLINLTFLDLGNNPVGYEELIKICEAFPPGIVNLDGNEHCQFILEEKFNQQLEDDAESIPILHEQHKVGDFNLEGKVNQLQNTQLKYLLHAGSFNILPAAEAHKNKLHQLGYTEAAVAPAKSGWYNVQINRFATRDEAEAVMRELKEKYGIAAWVEEEKGTR